MPIKPRGTAGGGRPARNQGSTIADLRLQHPITGKEGAPAGADLPPGSPDEKERSPMNARKNAKELNRTGLALVLAGAIIFATSGCDPVGFLGNLNTLGVWISSIMGSFTSTGL
jgi:hypothetical protein